MDNCLDGVHIVVIMINTQNAKKNHCPKTKNFAIAMTKDLNDLKCCAYKFNGFIVKVNGFNASNSVEITVIKRNHLHQNRSRFLFQRCAWFFLSLNLFFRFRFLYVAVELCVSMRLR